MSPHELHSQLQRWLNRQREVLDHSLSLDLARDGGFLIRGTISLTDGHTLHVSEYYASAADGTPRKYRYQLQNLGGALGNRWDNAPHHLHIPTFPHHVHLADGRIQPSFVHNLYELIIEMRRTNNPLNPA